MDFRRFKNNELREVLKILNKPTTANKKELQDRIERSFQDDPQSTQRAIEIVYRKFYVVSVPPQTLHPNQPSYPQHAPEFLFPNLQCPPQQQQQQIRKVTPSYPSERIELAPIRELELSAHEGLLDNYRMIGKVLIDNIYPKVNEFITMPLSLEETASIRNGTSKITIRFILYDPNLRTFKFPPIWPSNCLLKINGDSVFDNFSKNKMSFTPAGQNAPFPSIDVTSFWVQSQFPVFSVHIQVAMNSSQVKWLAVAAVLKKKDKHSIFESLKRRSPSFNDCVLRAVSLQSPQCSTSGDEDIDVTETQVSLLDASSFLPIEIATRGINCTHIQCFDFFTHLEMNEKARTPKWRCPICSKEGSVSNLILDSWFQSILDKRTNETKVRINNDASFIFIPKTDDEDDSDDSGESNEEEEDSRFLEEPDHKRLRSLSPFPFDFQTPPLHSPIASPQSLPHPVKNFKAAGSKDTPIELLEDDDVLFG